jgi:single-strand DNA-binding protein
MAGINKVTILGNLGRDPEVRTTQYGKIVNLNVATSENWNDKQSGERKERTEWHRVVIYNERLADVAEKYLRKGSKVYLEGQNETRKYEKDGVDVYTTEVVLRQFRGELQLVDSRGSSSDEPSGGREDRNGSRGGRDDRGGGREDYGRDARGGREAPRDAPRDDRGREPPRDDYRGRSANGVPSGNGGRDPRDAGRGGSYPPRGNPQGNADIGDDEIPF